MSRSSFVEVNITNSTRLAQDSQNTADTAVKGVTDLNDPNLMNVIEKQTQASQYAGLTSQYNVILKRANDSNISTTALTTAYTNLNTFMAKLLTDTTNASNIDRDTYKNLTDAYNMALSTVQNELSDSFNADIDNMQSSVSVASQAAFSAAIVASQAATTGDNANQAASRAIVVANDAQSAGNNAISVANNASQAASNAILVGSQATVKADKASTAANDAQSAGNNAISVANNASQAADNAISVGSQAAAKADKASTAASQAQIAGNNATSVANNASQAASNAILAGSTATASANKAIADYQTLSAGVKDGSVVHITTETVIDKEVIGTAEIANGAITNAQIGKEAVGSAQIAELAVGTAQIGDGAITNAKIGKLAVGTAQIANGAITNAQIGSEAVGSAQIVKEAVGSAQIANLAVGTAQIGDGAITNAKIGKLAVGTAQIANGAITNAQIGSLAVGTANIKDAAISSAKIADLAVGTAQIGDGAITNAKIGKLAVGTAQIANAAITDAQVGNVSANKLTAGTIDFNMITGKNINASNITTGKLSTDRLNVGQLSALSADLGNVTTGSLKGVDIVAKTFSTPNGSFTTDSNGTITAKNMTLIGGTLTSPTINTSTINGSTINGTTFHGGDIISDSNNTSQLYPTTISSNGHIYTTGFNSADAMQTDLSTGSLTTKYRATNSSSNQYEAYDTNISPNQIVLLAGHTNGKDMSFSQSVTGSNQDGYVLISPLDGITIHGDTQQIHFNGTSTDVTPKGIAFTPYGNINATGTQGTWYIGNNSNMLTASFGIDNQNNNHIGFYRPLFVDEIGAISSSNGGALFLHGQDNSTGQILLKKDSTGPQVLSASIYNRTYSGGSTVTVTGVGTLGRITSASKYKLAIAREPQVEPADRLLTINPSSWVDLEAAKAVARNKSNGEALLEHEQSLDRYHGLIAEDLRDAGLDEFVIYGVNGEIEGIQYDRLWTVLIPKIKQLNERLNELERKSI
ncbi:beta strand repeat-containing protein [Lactiplantibacillus plantarum]|uniref:beta strand repeat-containing protein n=1 Tax=Lactiplantibacillus plantarum TaxID=1590 RepID=UPI003F53AF64